MGYIVQVGYPQECSLHTLYYHTIIHPVTVAALLQPMSSTVITHYAMPDLSCSLVSMWRSPPTHIAFGLHKKDVTATATVCQW